MKIVVNKCFGGFRLSDEAYEWLIKNKNWKVTDYNKEGTKYKNPKAQLVRNPNPDSIMRSKYYEILSDDKLRVHPDVIECVKKLGKNASSHVSDLRVIEIPDNIEWVIDEYDGVETVHEKHRSW